MFFSCSLADSQIKPVLALQRNGMAANPKKGKNGKKMREKHTNMLHCTKSNFLRAETSQWRLLFEIFSQWNTHNFITWIWSFYTLMPGQNYNNRHEKKISVKKKFCVLFWSLKFFENLGIILSRHYEWGP